MKTQLIFILVLIANITLAQSFSNIAPSLGMVAINNNNLHGAGISFVDFDQDGWDDLTISLDGEIKTYRNVNGSAVQVNFGFEVDDNAKIPLWVDFDNDNDLDFYFTQYFGPNKLYRNDGGVFTEITASAGLPQTNVSTFGASWGDYDRDGDLDLFECNYIYIYTGNEAYTWSNHLYRNNGDGTFSDVTLAAGVSDGISLSFQSVWCDVNNDQWPDLYVINDLEHPNRLYINQTDGTFSEEATLLGASVAEMDAMTIAAGDFNRDGWEDFFITNTSIGPCALLQNNESQFVNLAQSSGVTLFQLTWGAVWFDQDNDQDLDLYVCENNYNVPQLPNPFLKNNGSGFFVNQALSTFLLDYNDSYSVAKGDWNNDGYVDIAVNNFAPQNMTLWRSNGGGSKWIKFKTQGTVSNTQGVGAKVQIWSGGQLQTATRYCGESYLGQHSQTLHFGLATNTLVDSVHVSWPSGFIDRYYGLNANTVYSLVEGETYACSITASATEICTGDSAVLICDSHSSYQWTTGENANEITVFEPGIYSVLVTSEYGFTAEAQIAIEANLPPSLEIAAESASCFNNEDASAMLVSSSEPVEFEWFAAPGETVIENVLQGWYAYTFIDSVGCVFLDSLFLSAPEPLLVEANATPVTCYGWSNGEVELFIDGGTAPYVVNWGGLNSTALEGGTHEIEISDNQGCTITASFEITSPLAIVPELASVGCEEGELFADIETTGGIPPYTWWWSNGSTNEDLTAAAGGYVLIVTDAVGCTSPILQVECPSATEELYGRKWIYPNPTSKNVYVPCASCTYIIRSINGTFILSGIASSDSAVDVGAIAPGSYVVTWVEGNKVFTSPLIILE